MKRKIRHEREATLEETQAMIEDFERRDILRQQITEAMNKTIPLDRVAEIIARMPDDARQRLKKLMTPKPTKHITKVKINRRTK